MNVKIMAADQYATNNDGSAWKPTKQVTTGRTWVFKISYDNLSGSDVYLWVYDVATAGGSAAPLMVRRCPSTFADTWDFYANGTLFKNGVYIVIATGAPASPASTPTGVADNAAMLKVEFRQAA